MWLRKRIQYPKCTNFVIRKMEKHHLTNIDLKINVTRTHHEKNKNIKTWINTNKQTDKHKATYISSYLRKAQVISPEVRAY